MKVLLCACLSLLLINVKAQNTFPSSGNSGIGITSSLTHPLTIKPLTDGTGLLLLPPTSNPNTNNYLQFGTHPFNKWIYEVKANQRLDLIASDQLFLFANDIFFQGNAVVTRNNVNNPTSVADSKSSGTMPFETNLYNSTINAGVITYAGLQNIASGTVMGGHRLSFKMNALRSNLSDGTEVFNIQSNGTVGTSTTDTKNYKLAVNGAAIFTKVVVKTYGTWADFVFDKSYKLPTLQEVEQYLMIKGGPEGIHGLPGMILGVGVPRLHSTWFATKVQVFDVNMNTVVPATKGKKVNRATMMKSLDKVLRQWGSYGSKMIVNFEI